MISVHKVRMNLFVSVESVIAVTLTSACVYVCVTGRRLTV